MATSYSPKIVTDSLALCVDVRNEKSYPSSGGAYLYDIGGSGLQFAGAGAYISYTNGVGAGSNWATSTTSILNTDYHSIFFTIMFNSTVNYPNGISGNWDKIVSFNAGGSDRTPGIWRQPGNRAIHWRYDPGNTGLNIFKDGLESGTDFSTNTWYYVGVTKNGGTATAYVNGKTVGNMSVAFPKTAGNAPIYLYESYPANLSSINNLTIHTKVLTPTEILQNYNAIRGRFGI